MQSPIFKNDEGASNPFPALTSLLFIRAMLASFFVLATMSIGHAQGTQKVPTSRIIFPETSSDEEVPTIEVPVDELPSTEPGILDTAEEELDSEPGEDEDDHSLEPAETTERPVGPSRITGPLPEIVRDLSKLPPAVAQTRQNILDAARSGDIKKLRPFLGVGDNATELTVGNQDSDPIDFLTESSGDDEGHEILAILIEIFETGYVHMDQGKDSEVYLWPYFFAYPLDKLTGEMRVELFRILTAGDYEDARAYGGYNFYRAGIKPDGTWAFFVAGH